MVFDTFSDTQTLCRPDRNRNTTCCFSDGAFLFGSDLIRFRSFWSMMQPVPPFHISYYILENVHFS